MKNEIGSKVDYKYLLNYADNIRRQIHAGTGKKHTWQNC